MLALALLMFAHAFTLLVVPESCKRVWVGEKVEVRAVSWVRASAFANGIIEERWDIFVRTIGWGASAMLVNVVPVLVRSAIDWVLDALASWQVPEVIVGADGWLADAAALIWIFDNDVPDET